MGYSHPIFFSEICCMMLRTSHLVRRNSSVIFQGFSCPPNLIRCCSHEGSHNHDNLRRMKLIKRLASTLLFGGTFATAVYFRNKKRNHMKDLLEGCERLPNDPNYAVKNSSAEYFRYKNCILPGMMIKAGVIKELDAFETTKEDIFVVSFPRSGTTWLQEVVYLIHTKLNFEKAASQVLETRFPYLENVYPGLKSISQMKGPRLIKTHMPFGLLPKSVIKNNTKVIYITRNPKDAVVSYYHFARMFTFFNYTGTFEEFVEKFMKDEVLYTPFFKHVQGYWNERDNPDFLFLHFEDMKKDPEGTIRKIAEFLNNPLTDDQITMIMEHTKFHRMVQNPSVNYRHWDDFGLRNKQESNFLRKGEIGDWKNYFTPKFDAIFTKWITKNLEGSDLQFQYEAS